MVEKNLDTIPKQYHKYKAKFFKNRGYYHFRKTDYENSILNYQKAVEIDPHYIDAWCELGLVHFTIGNIDEANKCLDKLNSMKGDTKRK
jgi:tetratricopeptide (TPR) repeat protein